MMADHAPRPPAPLWTPEQHAIAMHFWRNGIQVARIGERIAAVEAVTMRNGEVAGV